MDTVEVQWLGRIAYTAAWELQKSLVPQVGNGDLPHQLLLLEHPPTYTFGRKGKPEHLLYTESELTAAGIAVHHVDRGGDITYHGPGQLIGYPILNLRQLQADYPNPTHYLRSLEQTIIDTLTNYHIKSWQYPGYTGVWVHHLSDESPVPEPYKVAAIGAKFNGNGVSSHGFALNVAPNMAHFTGIVPCGIAEHAVISLATLLARPPTIKQIIPHYLTAFQQTFGLTIQTKTAA